ncbi:hypothetical protein [Bdellovibrio svalbardensis]|uniref:Glycine zipper domain-containing protein n=1 Tax=Bdellovibrio svalbardensis TaxID=2972972 RepID=A0ABT6DMB7_9BACT|nr:hypothetical protein [Bdellovibrio svalbardensis]MDG0817791.1 hypothetical protein [Bdellovibrio svalbardensis]
MKISALLLSLCLFISACATNQKSRLAATAVGIGVGGVIGAATAPENERKELHAMYWAGIVGVVTAIAANYYWNDENDLKVMKLENDKLKSELGLFEGTPSVLLRPFSEKESKRIYKKDNVKMNLYKRDEWVDDGPYRKYHQDQMLEIVPLEKK